ncbi:MAG TPA: head GIN domain-containing protein [Bacteroidales bacterium]|nr:head GIN domain-containing protein [Bacteroidales bacterium]HSA42626.1 head GIN domain-containing protein [Bacteroidales bacterium]
MNTIDFRLGVLSLPLIAVLFLSCSFDCENGSGEIVSEDRDIREINGVKLQIPADLLIEQGNTTSFRIEAQQNILSLITTTVSQGVLTISSQSCFGIHKPIRIRVSTPDIRKLSVSGSGAIRTENPVNTGKLELAVQGSGSIQIDANCEVLYSGIKGSGEMILSGTAHRQYVRIDGSGAYNAGQLASTSTEVEINGSGTAEVFPVEKLGVDIRGSAVVRYSGKPVVSSRIDGSGEVQKTSD